MNVPELVWRLARALHGEIGSVEEEQAMWQAAEDYLGPAVELSDWEAARDAMQHYWAHTP